MSWFKEHERGWRVAFLMILGIAMLGPWSFDRISVPQPYSCSSPNVRLDDTFCGMPIPVTLLLLDVPLQFAHLVNELITGSTSKYASAEWLSILFSIFLVFPFLSTSILILGQEQRYWSAIHCVALGLAVGTGLLIGILGFSVASWRLWGVWLYTCLTVCMWVVEVSIFKVYKKRVEA